MTTMDTTDTDDARPDGWQLGQNTTPLPTTREAVEWAALEAVQAAHAIDRAIGEAIRGATGTSVSALCSAQEQGTSTACLLAAILDHTPRPGLPTVGDIMEHAEELLLAARNTVEREWKSLDQRAKATTGLTSALDALNGAAAVVSGLTLPTCGHTDPNP